eukprot:scaffold24889_cov67-Isochrysis_galbana.AAC.1
MRAARRCRHPVHTVFTPTPSLVLNKACHNAACTATCPLSHRFHTPFAGAKQSLPQRRLHPPSHRFHTSLLQVLNRACHNAACIVRPPGHHAGWRGLREGTVSCGFCVFNSVMVRHKDDTPPIPKKPPAPSRTPR